MSKRPASSSDPATVQSLADLRPDPRNSNRGTDRGRAALEQSLLAYGAGRAILIDRHGHIIAGNKTAAEARRLNLPLRVVQTDGTVLVAVQRSDLDVRHDPRAQQLAVADNRVGELDLEWDIDMLKEIHAEGLDLSAFWTDEEFAALLGLDGADDERENAVVEPASTDIQPGELILLGKHRLLCGDATAAEDVARYCQLEEVAGTVGGWTAMPPATTATDSRRRSSVMPSGSTTGSV